MYDTHAHLADLPENAVDRAREAGLEGILAVSVDAASCEETLRLEGKYSGFVHTALGVHPTEFFDQDLPEVLALIRENSSRSVAVGEIGLDYWHKLVRKDKVMREKQRGFYVAQLELAEELDLPVSIHSRGAWRDCLSLANEHGPCKGIFHWYSGPLDVLSDVLDSGYYVSCTPAVEGSPELRAAMGATPLERILVETDSPVWIKGLERASEPLDVRLTVSHLSALKGIPVGDVDATTAKNAETLFRL